MPLYQVNAGDRILAADINQFYQLLKGVAASGETVTLIYNNQSLIFQPSSDPVAGTRVVVIKNNAGTTLASWRYDALLELLAAAAAPATAVAGSIYWDTVLNALRVYDGTAWLETNLGPYRWTWYWAPGMTVETTFTGTGAYTPSAANTSASLSTGATSGSTAGLRMLLGTVVNTGPGVNSLKRWSFSLAFNEVDANTTEYFFLTNESATGAPSVTARHLGLKQVAGAVSFTTADNTTEQTTSINAFITGGQDNRYTVTFDGTTARLYIDGTLRATHATNVPGVTSANVVFRAYATNAAAANKQLLIGRMDAVLAVA